VNYMAALMLSNHEAFQLGNARSHSEALSPNPSLGAKVRAVLEGLRDRLTVDAPEGPATPALLDYPYRS
jgi:hypothetical protein